MIEALLPDGVVAVDTREDWPDVVLFPEEETAIERAVENRRREFVTARGCARRALEKLGLPPTSIPVGSRGEPSWPTAVVGSITHCRGYRGCALARATSFAAIGIDAEPHEELPPGLLDRIARGEERARLGELMRAEPAVHWDRLLFCAKEAAYKTCFPLTKRRLDFEDTTIAVDPSAQTFHIRLLVPGPLVDERRLAALDGRWSVHDGLIFTAIALAHR